MAVDPSPRLRGWFWRLSVLGGRRPARGPRTGVATSEPQPATAPRARNRRKPAGMARPMRQPPPSPSAAGGFTTKQTVTLPGRTLAFTATAGSIRLFNERGDPQADIAYTAYQLDGADPATPPVTFFFNGGPGAASAYLQLGAAGPWRLPIGGEAAMSSASPDLVPNAETWLDFTDLVFIDPVGTGYSRFVAADEDVRKQFFSVDGDVNALASESAAGWKSPTVCVPQIRRRRKL